MKVSKDVLLFAILILSFVMIAPTLKVNALKLPIGIKWVLAKQKAHKTAKRIPKSLKVKGNSHRIDLNKFKDKNGQTPKTESNGTFKYGKWIIVKLITRHLAYNGHRKKWLLRYKSIKKAYLDKHGAIVGQ
ncbi:putative membrane protein YfhO [Scopulibacillus daqui]|uniref:Membrane protein YfhO n=1 Tax=Scopulibacillus daqui TaxID=1469162 RepID=A0ABS2Q3H4_9BACL|nr:hypothetical protein [Scopulibacillus daqui]MBM7646778.1 putative membrane protein YfhO [Scopulibacillus daqui]